MYAMLAAVALSVSAPIPVPPDATAAPTGPAPTLVFLKADGDGKVLVTVRRTTNNAAPPIAPANVPNAQARAIVVARAIQVETVELGEVKDLTITTVDGRKVALEEALKRLQKGETVLIASAGQPISPAYLKVFKDDTLILSSPELMPPTAVAPPVRAMPVQPGIRIQPAVIPPVPVPPAAQKQVEIQILPAVEAAPLQKAIPAEKILPIEKAVPPAEKVTPQLPALPQDR